VDWNLAEATEYIRLNAVDNEDFLAGDSVSQTRFLNVSQRTLARRFKGAIIPVEATYLFAAVLNANYNDTTIMAQRGVAGFSLDGISFTFKDWALKDLSEFIPDEVEDMINEANPDLDGGNGRVKWVTL